LAGFAFSALLLESDTITRGEFFAEDTTGSLEGAFNTSAGTIELSVVSSKYDYLVIMGLCIQWLEVAAIAICFGQMLFVLQHGLVAQLLGYRLALRGRDGAINQTRCCSSSHRHRGLPT